MKSQTEIDVADIVDQQKRTPYQLSIMLWLMLILFTEGFDNQVLSYAAPSIMDALDISKASFGIVFAGTIIGYIGGATVLADIADRIGRKPLIVAGLFLFGGATFLTPFCTELYQLVLARLFTGIGLGATMPVTNALTVELSPRRNKATTFAAIYMGYVAGSSVGGLAAAGLMAQFGWKSLFYIGGLMPLLLAVLLIMTLPESPLFMASREQYRVRLVAFLRKLAPDAGIDEQSRFIAQRSHQSGLAAKHLFTEGRLWMTLVLWLAFMGSFATHHFWTSWLPTILVDTGHNNAEAIFAASMSQFGAAAGALVVANIADRFGSQTLGYCKILGAGLIASMALVGTSSGMPLLVTIFFVGVIYLGATVGLTAFATMLYPPNLRSTGIGYTIAVGRVGSLIGVSLSGIIMESSVPSQLIFPIMALPGLICGICILFLAIMTGTGKVALPRGGRH